VELGEIQELRRGVQYASGFYRKVINVIFITTVRFNEPLASSSLFKIKMVGADKRP
jgi:hypothetical protein